MCAHRFGSQMGKVGPTYRVSHPNLPVNLPVNLDETRFQFWGKGFLKENFSKMNEKNCQNIPDFFLVHCLRTSNIGDKCWAMLCNVHISFKKCYQRMIDLFYA